MKKQDISKRHSTEHGDSIKIAEGGKVATIFEYILT